VAVHRRNRILKGSSCADGAGDFSLTAVTTLKTTLSGIGMCSRYRLHRFRKLRMSFLCGAHSVLPPLPQPDSISALLIHEVRTMQSFEKLLIAFCILAKPDSLTDPEADRLSGSRITRQQNKGHLVVSGAAHTTFRIAQFFKFNHLFYLPCLHVLLSHPILHHAKILT
jgi:hypothetical protein